MSADAEQCQRCGDSNVTWFAPSPLWNYVMRGNDINREPRFGDMVCPRCFVLCAIEVGVNGSWAVIVADGAWTMTVDPIPEDLLYETPSGRVWDPAAGPAGLWVEPAHARAGEGE